MGGGGLWFFLCWIVLASAVSAQRPPPVQIIGRVVDADGQALAGASIRVLDRSVLPRRGPLLREVARGRSDAAGEFAISARLGAQPVDFVVEARWRTARRAVLARRIDGVDIR